MRTWIDASKNEINSII
jgi:hypothetical protein